MDGKGAARGNPIDWPRDRLPPAAFPLDNQPGAPGHLAVSRPTNDFSKPVPEVRPEAQIPLPARADPHDPLILAPPRRCECFHGWWGVTRHPQLGHVWTSPRALAPIVHEKNSPPRKSGNWCADALIELPVTPANGLGVGRWRCKITRPSSSDHMTCCAWWAKSVLA